MAASKLQNYIEKYGPAAGPKLYHALQSRAAYIGANTRRRRAIAGLTRATAAKDPTARPDGSAATPLFAGAEAAD